MSLENDLKRIADALEIIASNSKFLSGLSSKAQALAKEVAAPKDPVTAALDATPTRPAPKGGGVMDLMLEEKTPSIGTLPKPEDREGIKAELDKRKIQYNGRLATKTLYEILLAETQPNPVSSGAKTEAVERAEGTVRPKPTPSAPANGAPVSLVEVPPAKDVSLDEVRQAMKAFAAIYGNDKALALLNPFGCQNLTEVQNAGRLAEFMEAMKKKGEEYDASARKAK